MLTLHIIGCSDAFNSGGRRHTSFLLENAASKILIDCGANTVQGFKQLKLDFSELDCVVISHFHGDHYGGLPYLILEAAKLQKRKKPLLLVSPPGLKEKLAHLMKLLYQGSEDALEAFPIEYISYHQKEKLKLPFGSLTAFEVVHATETQPHGIRLETGGKIISYSGDTSWNENLIKLSEGSDLFICECNFFSKKSHSHLDYHTLGEKQKIFNTKRLVLTHLGEEMLEREEEITIEILKEGQQIRI